jgi:murein DD-endopeptidase MepM/ murein hydrolase activator NlpD
MPPDKSKSVKLKNKMSESFRLTLHKNPNFEEKGRVNFSLFQFYLFVFLGLTALVIFVASMIIFTPIRGLIPGYGDLSHPKKIRELSMALEDMEARLQANELYTTNFMKMLKDSTQTVDDVGSDLPVQSSVKTQIVEKVKEDAEIRQEIAFSNQNNDNMTLTTNSDQQSISLDRIYFLPPLMGPVSATYEPNKKHFGIDILAPKNTPIKASLDGYVIQSDWTMDAGNTLGIQHDNNIVTFYKHNSTLLKKVGDQVKAGEAIAIIGNSGELTDGPHLHFEIWHKGKTINPADFVEF